MSYYLVKSSFCHGVNLEKFPTSNSFRIQSLHFCLSPRSEQVPIQSGNSLRQDQQILRARRLLPQPGRARHRQSRNATQAHPSRRVRGRQAVPTLPQPPKQPAAHAQAHQPRTQPRHARVQHMDTGIIRQLNYS